MNKILVILFLLMSIFGLSMSVNAKSSSVTNTMEVGKTYTVNEAGQSKVKGDSINMVHHSYLVRDTIDSHGLDSSVWRKYTTGFDMAKEGIVKVECKEDPYIFSKGRFLVTPLKAGDFDTKTKHQYGDSTYYWHFV